MRQRFGEEVRQVVVSRHEGDNDVQVLDAFPNEEMPSFNMFHARMMLPAVVLNEGLFEFKRHPNNTLNMGLRNSASFVEFRDLRSGSA